MVGQMLTWKVGKLGRRERRRERRRAKVSFGDAWCECLLSGLM